VVALGVGRAQLMKAIRRFVDRLKSMPRNTIAVVYYGGQAVLVDGSNYIFPADIRVGKASDLKDEAVSIQDIVEAMQSTNVMASVIMLDACRENPFTRTYGSR
jgi:uncharacterized caspase-like protein